MMLILGLYFALFSAQKLVELASELALAANVPTLSSELQYLELVHRFLNLPLQ